MTGLTPPGWWVAVAVVAALGFLLGGVNPASIFARVLGKDLSQYSGNPGATNAGRVLGRGWGVLVGLLDVLKGLLPAGLAHWGLGPYAAYVVGVSVVLGHVYSPYLRGRGGKGVATTLGAVLAVHPWYAVALVLAFGLVFAITRWVALGSLCAATLLVVGAPLAGLGLMPGAAGWPTAAWGAGLGLLIAWRHRSNVTTSGRPGHVEPTQGR